MQGVFFQKTIFEKSVGKAAVCSFSYTLTFQTPEQEPEKTYCCLWPKYFQKTIFEKPVGKATVCSFAKLYFSNSGKRTGKNLFMIFSKTIFGEATVCSFCKLYFSNSGTGTGKSLLFFSKDYFRETDWKNQCAAVFAAQLNFSSSPIFGQFFFTI